MTKVASFFKKFYIAIIFVILYLPPAVMAVLSFNDSRSAYKFGGFTFDNYIDLFSDDSMMRSVMITIVLALSSAFISTVIGTAACVGISSMNKHLRKLYIGVSNIPMLNADIVTGVALMLLFVRLFGGLSAVTVGIAHITLTLPYVILNVLPKMHISHNSAYEAALDLGASPVKAFFRVVLPDIFPSVLTSFLMAITLSLDDFIITYFTSSSEISTISTNIYTNRIRGIQPEYYALSTLMFVAVLVVLLLANRGMLSSDSNKRRKKSYEK